jgi:uncharacterized Zn finger protein
MDDKMKCPNCGSENVTTREELHEGKQMLWTYGECKDCGNAWELDQEYDEDQE